MVCDLFTLTSPNYFRAPLLDVPTVLAVSPEVPQPSSEEICVFQTEGWILLHHLPKYSVAHASEVRKT